eukprot:3531088-Alexandrium_andersonii.AAC.1
MDVVGTARNARPGPAEEVDPGSGSKCTAKHGCGSRLGREGRPRARTPFKRRQNAHTRTPASIPQGAR